MLLYQFSHQTVRHSYVKFKQEDMSNRQSEVIIVTYTYSSIKQSISSSLNVINWQIAPFTWSLDR